MIITLYAIIILGMVIGDLQVDERQPKEVKKEVDFYKTRAWRNLRYEVLKFYEATCMCCGASRESGDQIHVDHIYPRSLYPDLKLEFSNMAVLCACCNIAKSNTDFTDWRNAEELRLLSERVKKTIVAIQ